jgi:glycosyltransferase involved in cell wall biosynthesis
MINKKQSPLISIILTTYNRRELLPYAIQSVLNQTYTNYEVIVINDFGEDVFDVFNAYNTNKIYYHSLIKNSGPSYARNTGILLAKGNIIFFLDDDDLFLPNHLEEVVAIFNNHIEVDVVYTDAKYVHEKLENSERYILSEEKKFMGNKYSYSKLLIGNYIPINSIAYRKYVFKRVGMFDENIRLHEDWDFLLRLGKKYPFYYLNRITVEVRNRITIEDNLLSDNSDNYYNSYLEIYKKYPSQNLCVSKKRQQIVQYYLHEQLKKLGGKKLFTAYCIYLREKLKLRIFQILFILKYKSWDKEC